MSKERIREIGQLRQQLWDEARGIIARAEGMDRDLEPAEEEAVMAKKRSIDRLTEELLSLEKGPASLRIKTIGTSRQRTENPLDDSSMWRRRLDVQKAMGEHTLAVIEENERGQRNRDLAKHLDIMERQQADALERLDALREEEKLLLQMVGGETEETRAADKARVAAVAAAKSRLHAARLDVEKARIAHRDSVNEENERGQRNRDLAKHLDTMERQQADAQRQAQLEYQRKRGQLTEAAVRFADTDNNNSS